MLPPESATLLEAFADLDALPNYLQQEIKLYGHDLADASRALQSPAIFDSCLIWFDRHYDRCLRQPSHNAAKPPSTSPAGADSWLAQELSAADQFIVLRVVYKQRYLTLFTHVLRGILDFQLDLADVCFPSFKLLIMMENLDFIARALGMTNY